MAWPHNMEELISSDIRLLPFHDDRVWIGCLDRLGVAKRAFGEGKIIRLIQLGGEEEILG
jgi:hypothetical protein